MNGFCPNCPHCVAPKTTADRIREWCAINARYVSIDEAVDEETAAEILERARSTLANWRSAGRGPRSFRRGRIRYRIDDLAEWLDAGGDD
jgi:hypothetical protein